MSLSAKFNGMSHRSRGNLRGMLVVALLIPGCAGKKLDLLTSQADESAGSGTESTLGTDSAGSSADESPLIARSERSGPLSRLTSFARRRDGGTSEGRLAQRFQSMWGNDGADEGGITTDPFVQQNEVREPQPSASQHLVQSESSTVQKLLSNLGRKSTQPDSPVAQKKWWEQESPQERPAIARRTEVEQTFSDGFDSRLDQLRAELASAPEEPAKEHNPFADAGPAIAKRDDSMFGHGNDLTDDKSDSPIPVRMSTPVAEPAPATESFANAVPPRKELFTLPRAESNRAVNEQLQSLMADAHSARERGDLELAYRKALEAQALAVLENVRFAPGQSRPERLAEVIKAQLQGTAPPALAGNQLPVIQDKTARADESIFHPIDFPALGPIVGSWDPIEEGPMIVPDERQGDVSLSANRSGVNLFPPGDDFPSEAEMFEWVEAQDSIADVRPGAPKPASEKIHLTIHQGSDGLRDVATETRTGQLPGFTEQDNQDLISSVSEQKNRVFELSKMDWPSLPPLTVDEAETESEQNPIMVAAAPRMDLDVQTATIATADPAPTSTPTAPVESGSLIAQIWRTRSIWLVGGLVLAVIALRLMPWPRERPNE